MREILVDMVRQFACWSDDFGGYMTGGLSVLEDAFEALGWSDPMPWPQDRCDEPGCLRKSECGWPDGDKYRRTCGPHYCWPAKVEPSQEK